MALKHKLSLEIPDVNNVGILRVYDTSIYTDTLSVKCPTLEITSPGYKKSWRVDPTEQNFTYNLNACTLGMISSGCDENNPPLPDGIYKIRYSVSPNDKVYVEYLHLRVSQTFNLYNNELCKLDVCAGDLHSDTKYKLNKLREIRDYIDAAKVKVEHCHDPHKGMQLFLYVQRRLEDINKRH